MREVGLIQFIFVGLMAGWIAGLLVRGPVRRRGCITNMVVGMLGAVIGGSLFKLVGVSGGAGFIGAVVTATIGAVILLSGLRLLGGG